MLHGVTVALCLGWGGVFKYGTYFDVFPIKKTVNTRPENYVLTKTSFSRGLVTIADSTTIPATTVACLGPCSLDVCRYIAGSSV